MIDIPGVAPEIFGVIMEFWLVMPPAAVLIMERVP
jgi:hypothetical protein